MRLSTAGFLALPLLAAATTPTHQESPLDQAKAQAAYWFEKLSSYIPNPNRQSPISSATAAAGSAKIHTLTLDNWQQTLRGSIAPETTSPEEWWVLTTGGNKTCYGLCAGVETAYNESAVSFATAFKAPSLAILNCDDQPVLCNSWGAGPPNLWIMDVRPEGSPVDIRIVGLNTTTTTAKTFTDLHTTKSYKQKPVYEGYFHPFDGVIAKNGLALPVGYVLWFFAVIPSWAFMVGISFLSRTMMSRRTAGPQARAAAAAPRRGAPAGDGVAY